MSKFKTRSTLIALILAGIADLIAAQAQAQWTNSAMYNGYWRRHH